MQGREGVCVGLAVAEGPSGDFQYFPRGTFGFLGTFGNGAPPHARIHLNIQINPSGSPPTKFGPYVTACNRHLAPFGSLYENFTPGDTPRRSDSAPRTWEILPPR